MDESVFVEALYGVKHLKSKVWELSWVFFQCIFQGGVQVLHYKIPSPLERAINFELRHYWNFVCIFDYQHAVGKEIGLRCLTFDYGRLKLHCHILSLSRVVIESDKALHRSS